MRSIFSFLALALLIIDGGYTHPTPAPDGMSDDAMAAHAIKVAEDFMHNYDNNNNHYLSKRFNWGGALNIAGKVAGGLLGAFFKRDQILPTVQLDKRGLSFLKAHEIHNDKRGPSFLSKYKGIDSTHNKRSQDPTAGVQFGNHTITTAGAQLLKSTVGVATNSLKDQAEAQQKVSDKAEIEAGKVNGNQSPADRAYLNALSDIQVNDNKSDKQTTSTAAGEGRRVRRGPNIQTQKAATDDKTKVESTFEAAAASIVADQNKGQSVSPLESNVQRGQVASVLGTTALNKVNEAMSNSSQPIEAAQNEELEKAEGSTKPASSAKDSKLNLRS